MVAENQYTVGSLFAGIGGICIGFSEAGCKVVWANEIDHYACITYEHNKDIINPNVNLIEGDIRNLTSDQTSNVTILAGGFPCQPFSLAGNRKGFDDPRGQMFFELLKIAKKCKPRVIFLENVNNLKTINDGNYYEAIKEELSKANYKFIWDDILNTKDYSNIPQNRSRIFFVAFSNEQDFNNFKSLPLIKNKKQPKFSKFFNFNTILDDHRYYGPNNAKHFDLFKSTIKSGNKAAYQYRRVYIRKNKNDLCPALTACMGIGGHNVPIIHDLKGIRKLTPEECLSLQGFPSDFEFPDIADGHRYKQVGNSVTVPVVTKIARNIISALEMTDNQ